MYISDSDKQMIQEYSKKHNTILCIPKSSKYIVDDLGMKKCRLVLVDEV